MTAGRPKGPPAPTSFDRRVLISVAALLPAFAPLLERLTPLGDGHGPIAVDVLAIEAGQRPLLELLSGDEALLAEQSARPHRVGTVRIAHEAPAAALAALGPALPHAGAAIVPLYAFSVCCAAVLLACTRHPSAALWCAGAPFALLAYFGVWGFHPSLELADRWVLVAVVLALAAYSPRVVAVARAWHRLHG